MKVQVQKFKKQAGIAVLGIIVIIALTLFAIAGAVVKTRAAANQPSDSSQKVIASSLLDQAAQIRRGFEQLQSLDNFSISNIVYDASAPSGAAVGLFNSTSGRAALVTPEGDAVAGGTIAPYWYYAPGANSLGVKVPQSTGTDGSYAIYVPNVNDKVCKAINAKVWGLDDNSPVPISSSLATSATLATNVTGTAPYLTNTALIDASTIGIGSGATAITKGGVAVSDTNFFNGFQAGCLTANGTANDNVFIEVIRL